MIGAKPRSAQHADTLSEHSFSPAHLLRPALLCGFVGIMSK